MRSAPTQLPPPTTQVRPRARWPTGRPQALLPLSVTDEVPPLGALWTLLVPSFFMMLLLLAADDVASQLENPWDLLPIQGLVDVGAKDMQA